MKRRLVIAGNWKMNNLIEESIALVDHISKVKIDREAITIIVAPPFTSIASCKEIAKRSGIKLSGQNLYFEKSGAYTGEVSALMLKDAGCDYVIIGHSERRAYFAESNELINKKIKAAISIAGLAPILCIGETLEERETGRTDQVIDDHLLYQLENLSQDEMKKVTIAYEPVWAIGTGKTATVDIVKEVHAYIRKLMKSKLGEALAESIPILYGGSVKPENSKELFETENVDGALIGGASLKASDFISIIESGKKVLGL